MGATVTTGVSINSGELLPCEFRIEYEQIDLSTAGPLPDKNWSATDSNGHFHAYNQQKKANRPYPTLIEKSRHVECNGCDDEECEGYNEYWYECAICDEIVKPGQIAGPHRITEPGMMIWWVEVTTSDPIEPVRVSVRVVNEQRELFGVAHRTEARSTGLVPGGITWHYKLAGASALGERTS